ncbi:MAG: hypothetical protein LBB61_08030, partial [Treponema sp.]|nr:hypothetical protein [Treponema sp.]
SKRRQNVFAILSVSLSLCPFGKLPPVYKVSLLVVKGKAGAKRFGNFPSIPVQLALSKCKGYAGNHHKIPA